MCVEKDVSTDASFSVKKGVFIMNYERSSIINDNAEYGFNEADNFQKFLTEMDRDSTWLEIEKCKEMSVEYAGSSDDIIEGITDEAFNDTVLNGSHLELKYNNTSYYVGSSALPTLKARAGISGTSLEKLERKDLSEVLSKCLRVVSGGSLLRICGDKIRACHSKNYQALSQSGIFRTARTTIEGYSNKIFIRGNWSHDYMTASWNIMDNDVIEAYADMLANMGVPVNKCEIQTVVSICTSDVGTSGATIWYNISYKNKMVVLGAGSKLNHKGTASISDFSHNLQEVFSSYKKKFFEIEDLKYVKIKHPVGCIYGLLKKADLPACLAKETAIRFKTVFGNIETDGLTLYVMGVNELLNVAKEKKASVSKLFTYQEKIARIIGYDFAKFDREAELVDL